MSVLPSLYVPRACLVTDGCELACMCWGLNLDPLPKTEQASALTTEPSLQPLPHPLLISMDYPSWIFYMRDHVL